MILTHLISRVRQVTPVPSPCSSNGGDGLNGSSPPLSGGNEAERAGKTQAAARNSDTGTTRLRETPRAAPCGASKNSALARMPLLGAPKSAGQRTGYEHPTRHRWKRYSQQSWPNSKCRPSKKRKCISRSGARQAKLRQNCDRQERAQPPRTASSARSRARPLSRPEALSCLWAPPLGSPSFSFRTKPCFIPQGE